MAAPLPPPPPSAQQPTTAKKVAVGVGLCCGLPFVALLAIGFLAGDPDEEAEEPAVEIVEEEPAGRETTTSAPSDPTTTSPPATVFDASGCTPADGGLVALVEGALVGEGWYLGEAFVGTSDVVYLTANIYEPGGERRSSWDAWIIDEGAPFALSGTARSDSALPDGRDRVDDPFSDPSYLAALSCTAGRNMAD